MIGGRAHAESRGVDAGLSMRSMTPPRSAPRPSWTGRRRRSLIASSRKRSTRTGRDGLISVDSGDVGLQAGPARRSPCRVRRGRRGGPAPGPGSRSAGDGLAPAKVWRCRAWGRQARLGEHLAEGAASSAAWMASAVPTTGTPLSLSACDRPSWGLAAELHDHARDRAGLLLRVDDLEHVLQGERLGSTAGRRCRRLGGDGLRRADHHGLVLRRR